MGDALAVWVVVTLLGLAAQPLAVRVVAPLPGAAAGLARPLGLLLAGVPLWWLASLDAVAFGPGAAWGAAGALAVAGLLAARRGTSRPRGRDLAVLLSAEAVFAGTFAAGLAVVSHAPDVWGTEKPMDMAFLAALREAGHLPPPDPWLSGEPLNYYYLGHYLMAFVTGLAGTGSTEGYNVAVALVWALTASAAFGLGAAAVAAARTGRAWLAGGSASAVLVALGGNAQAVRDLLAHDGPLRTYDWFAASRAVPGGINDFPAFEAVLGDLHAHVIATPFTLLVLALALGVALRGPALDARTAVVAVAAGALYPMSGWNLPVALAVVVVAAALARPALRTLAVWSAVTAAGALAAFLPFHLTFDTASAQGVGIVPARQALGPFLEDLAGGYGLALVPVCCLLAIRLDRRRARWAALAAATASPLLLAGDFAGPAVLLAALGVAVCAVLQRTLGTVERFAAVVAVAGLACLLAPELVYLRDAFDGGDHFRMNTLHKFGYQAWVLLGAAAGILVGLAVRRALAAPLVVLGAAALAFTPAAAWARTAGFAGPARLNGLGWLEQLAPGDPPAIAWLRAHAPRDAVLLEAVGPEYSPQGHARMATFTGRATVVGWEGHELFWGHADDLGTRASDVREVYGTPDERRARDLLDRYGVDFVVVGDLERSTYPGLDAAKFERLGRLAHAARGTAIYDVRGSAPPG